MKKNKIFFFSLLIFTLSACGIDIPLESEQYFKQIYLVRASTEEALEKEVSYAVTDNEVVISVAAGGSLNVDKEVTVTFTEDEEAITTFNGKFKASNEIQYQALPKNTYHYSETTATIKSGDVYGTYSIIVNPETLHCDSLYLLPIRIATISDYQLTEENTTLLVEIKLTNDYSGQYYIEGTRTTPGVEDSEITYEMFRELTAVNKNTVRLFHQVTEGFDNIQGNTFTISINNDNSLTFNTWEDFNLIGGGGSYDKEAKAFDLWYEYIDRETTYRIEGLLYAYNSEEEEE